MPLPLFDAILFALDARCRSRCMDDEADRVATAHEITKAVALWLDARRRAADRRRAREEDDDQGPECDYCNRPLSIHGAHVHCRKAGARGM